MKVSLALFGLSLLVRGLSAQSVRRAGPTELAITHVTVIDVSSGVSNPDMTVEVAGNRIRAVRKSSHAALPGYAHIVNGRGKFLIPGLWDMHVHALRDGRAHWMFPLFIAAGVLGIRDTGSPLDSLLFYRAGTAQGKVLGPRIFGTGPLLDGPQGQWPTFTVSVASPDEGRRAVDSLVRAGVDFIKVYNGLSREAFFAIADEARRRKVPVIGHVPQSVSALEASTAGMRSIEHLTQVPLVCIPDSVGQAIEREWDRRTRSSSTTPDSIEALRLETVDRVAAAFSETLCEQRGAQFARNGTWQVPTHERTLHWTRAYLGSDTAGADTLLRYVPARVRTLWKHYQDSLLTLRSSADVEARWYRLASRVILSLHRGGDRILAGTDTDGNDANIYGVPGFALHSELEAFVNDVGLTPLEALRSSTLDAARFLGIADSAGMIAPGKFADLVLLDADPLRDIRNARRIRGVIVNGRYLDRAALGRLLSSAKGTATRW
jgi:imidazolonepropionase-like amidohydrolase